MSNSELMHLIQTQRCLTFEERRQLRAAAERRDDTMTPSIVKKLSESGLVQTSGNRVLATAAGHYILAFP